MGDSGDAGSAAGSGGGAMSNPDMEDAGHLPGFTPSVQSVGTYCTVSQLLFSNHNVNTEQTKK